MSELESRASGATTHSAGQCGNKIRVISVPGNGGINPSGRSIPSSRARCSASGRKRLTTRPINVSAPSTGRTKIAVSRASTLDCHDAGPKCAVFGRSHQSGEFTILRVSGSWAGTTVSFVPMFGDSCLGHSVACA